MKFNRTLALVGLVATGALAVSACSNNTPSASGNAGTTNTAAAANCQQATINASGSTAQAKAMDAFTAGYAAVCDQVTVNYTASGSGAGVTDFVNNKTDFAGSDAALSGADITNAAARCKVGAAINLPMVVAPIAFVFNVKGVSKLTVNADVLASIFSGAITTWNDPAIAAINPGVTLPATTITTVHRSDGSGTTANFTKYLSVAAASKWTYSSGKVWAAPGGQGASGSPAVVAAVKSTDGAIAYVDGPDATANKLDTALLDSGAGGVKLDSSSVSKAIAAAKVTGTGHDLTLALDYTLNTAGIYPAVQVTYEITCEKGLPADKVKPVKSFLSYTVTDGQKLLAPIGYTPLPAALQAKVEASVAAIS